ncbi:lysophospholipase L1-like esterase [Dysgonomonas alginatilytica]|uniref:Lysophospholipase L1-like esterase n=1 Tax=Dysgonomonas alginatilytica TaxID=1605892 RepID=A0A2V3PQA6_9BACT|nr:GDSL-type esterase/lipase family protein [Dysgonomonas alginatilytica]PXV65919.1 lysophospholipase L1-like esterase [Dysgonomonas alginatilytica]
MEKHLVSFLFLFLIVGTSAFAQIKVACIGNSITFGAGVKDRDQNSYPSVLGQMLGNEYEVRNFGFSARTILNKGDHPYMQEQKFKDALEYNPDIVVIKLGTNDSKPQNWIYKDEYKHDLRTMVEAFQQLVSHPLIYLCYPAKAYTAERGINDSIIVNDIIPFITEVAEECNIKIINLHTPTSNMKENFPDQIHPNEAGARVLAKEVYYAITRKD